MDPLAYFRSIAAKFFHPTRIGHEVEKELSAHIQLRADDLERSGLDRAGAERQARIEFGSTEQFKAECREALGGNFIDTIFQDLRFSFRALRKSPAFFAVAVLTLALGIGATVAAFSIVNAVLLRPYGFREPHKLLWIYS
ncbi:MAG TPA: permease prefix domain 1-containing protein, partial [Chthoniobacterales bacterium]|nr:permease prefix domain 1-containing protein [Chthoniobacterales bacterium]